MRRLACTGGLLRAIGGKACYRQVKGFRADGQEIGLYKAWRIHGKRSNRGRVVADKLHPKTRSIVVRPDIYRGQSERPAEVFVILQDRRRIVGSKVDPGADEPIVTRRDCPQERRAMDWIAESKADERGRDGVDLRAIEIGFRPTDAPLVH